ncbi:hypothetical protein PAXRUDRAFT_261908 [Paxillus rubicundulus Ve08.2h10]|uniref:Uncharacterized protein n=1 Tax=Paxillus rubicundulus Ve08.2h10 TaxID=930991 RepID=A0A0D0E6B1_9AGAM|nr:hypothetical protein PAXRUDRAFT_261908 [Paxillus rubicundulus Ve08.2h10]
MMLLQCKLVHRSLSSPRSVFSKCVASIHHMVPLVLLGPCKFSVHSTPQALVKASFPESPSFAKPPRPLRPSTQSSSPPPSGYVGRRSMMSHGKRNIWHHKVRGGEPFQSLV